MGFDLRALSLERIIGPVRFSGGWSRCIQCHLFHFVCFRDCGICSFVLRKDGEDCGKTRECPDGVENLRGSQFRAKVGAGLYSIDKIDWSFMQEDTRAYAVP